MKIISKVKDYYDYLVSVYGIDENIIYDRRDCEILSKSLHHFFNESCINYNDRRKKVISICEKDEKGRYKLVKKEIGVMYYFCLEVGATHYIFNVERYLDEDKKVHIKPRLININNNCKKQSSAPISLIPFKIKYDFYINFDSGLHSFDIDNEIKNPILNGTYITSFINAEDIYNNLYNYLISKEKEIIDNRDDISKLESHGFDKKTSFRGKI